MSLDRAKVLALVGSDQAGERDAAVRAASRILQAAGMRWEQLAEGGDSGPGAEALRAACYVAGEQARFWREKAEAAERKADELRASARTYGRRVADLEARLEISARENAKLRAALGPEGAAQAVLSDNGAMQAMRDAAATQQPPSPPRHMTPEQYERHLWLMKNTGKLTDWEVGFLDGTLRQTYRLTEKQNALLDRLVRKAEAAAA